MPLISAICLGSAGLKTGRLADWQTGRLTTAGFTSATRAANRQQQHRKSNCDCDCNCNSHMQHLLLAIVVENAACCCRVNCNCNNIINNQLPESGRKTFSRVHLDTFHLAPAAVPMTLSSRIDPVRVQRPEATYSSWPRWLAASVCLCGVVRSSSLPAALAVRNANESQAASPSIGIGSCLAAVAHTQLPSFPTSHQPASLPASRTRRFPRLRKLHGYRFWWPAWSSCLGDLLCHWQYIDSAVWECSASIQHMRYISTHVFLGDCCLPLAGERAEILHTCRSFKFLCADCAYVASCCGARTFRFGLPLFLPAFHPPYLAAQPPRQGPAITATSSTSSSQLSTSHVCAFLAPMPYSRSAITHAAGTLASEMPAWLLPRHICRILRVVEREYSAFIPTFGNYQHLVEGYQHQTKTNLRLPSTAGNQFASSFLWHAAAAAVDKLKSSTWPPPSPRFNPRIGENLIRIVDMCVECPEQLCDICSSHFGIGNCAADKGGEPRTRTGIQN
uniref:HDC07807 n=1 Tax=Drosophila melanogaster TaxID=7227 RepID=Q6IM15_DROME|nr:TPA_inf: HDC07807 [Drosophila melanogaster]